MHSKDSSKEKPRFLCCNHRDLMSKLMGLGLLVWLNKKKKGRWISKMFTRKQEEEWFKTHENRQGVFASKHMGIRIMRAHSLLTKQGKAKQARKILDYRFDLHRWWCPASSRRLWPFRRRWWIGTSPDCPWTIWSSRFDWGPGRRRCNSTTWNRPGKCNRERLFEWIAVLACLKQKGRILRLKQV